MAAIALERLSRVFPGGTAGVRDLSLEIGDGELMVLVGPSGSGKSTVLRLIAGLDTPTSGRVRLDGEDVSAWPPQRRDVAMVFQSYALYPHLSVRDNLAFGLRMRQTAAPEIASRIARVAGLLGIEPLLTRKPSQLSGGQRQRVALGRAMVREPRAFLLDEPLSNLDPALRAETRTELALLHRRLGTTMVYVTHDQEEAMTLGTRIAVMRDGGLEQVGTPLEVFQNPTNTFVGCFVGSPAMNLVAAETLPSLVDGDPVGLLVGIRPHDVRLLDPGDAGAVVQGRVEVVETLGSSTLLHVRLERTDVPALRVMVPGDRPPEREARVGLAFSRHHLHLFDRSTGRRQARAQG